MLTNNKSNSSNNSYVERKTIWMPMKIIQFYLLSVFILFAFGPWPWPVQEKILVNSYILSAQVLLLLGYFLSVKSKKIFAITTGMSSIKDKGYNVQKIVRILLIMSIILIVPNYMSRVGMISFNPMEIINSFVKGLFNPGDQYHYKLSIQGQRNSNMLLLLITALTSPFRWLLIPLGIIHWSEIKWKYKIGIIMIIILDMMSWISIGTNKGIFDNVFIIVFSLIVKYALEGKGKQSIFSLNKSKNKLIIFAGLGIGGSLYYLTNAVKSRMGSVKYYYEAANISVNYKSPIMVLLPAFMHDTIVVISRYITQGYYGLSLALKEEFTSTLGFGNSWFLINIFEKITGNGSLERETYPFKLIKYGWDPYINWHSIYTWLASDFSFIGTLIIMLIIGYIFGEVWKSVLYRRNIYAIGLFILFMIMFIYFPANNQIFAFIDTFTAFWGLFILWLFTVKIKLR